MNSLPLSKKVLSFVLLLVLVVSLLASLVLVRQRQEIRKKAGGSKASGAQVVLYPSDNPSQSITNLKVGETQQYDLKVIFTGGSTDEKLVFFKTEIDYDTKFIQVAPDESIDTSMSGLDRVISLDQPQHANNAGKINIYLGAIAVDSAPNTSQSVTIAKIKFQGMGETPNVQNVTIGGSQVVPDNVAGVKIPYKVQNLSYNVVPSDSGIPTPPPTPILCNYTVNPPLMCPDGFECKSDSNLAGAGGLCVRVSPPVSPPISGTALCPLKGIGDANCDGKVDAVDYKIWRQEYDTMVAPNPVNQNAAFACVEGNKNTYFVDMVDYEIWRRNTVSGLILPQPTGVSLPSVTPQATTIVVSATPSTAPAPSNTSVPQATATSTPDECVLNSDCASGCCNSLHKCKPANFCT